MGEGEPVLVVGQRGAHASLADGDRASSSGTLIDWALFSAVFSGNDGSACAEPGAGACWPFITHKLGLFMYGRYPAAERWRVDLTYVLALAGLVAADDPARTGQAVDCRSTCSSPFRSSASCWCAAAFWACRMCRRSFGAGCSSRSSSPASALPPRFPSASSWRSGDARNCPSCAGRRSASSSSCAACRSSRCCSCRR